MSNEIATRRGGEMAVPLRAPVLPPEAANAVWHYLDRRRHGTLARFGMPALSDPMRRGAAAYVAEADAASGGPSFGVVKAWLLPLVASVGNPPSEPDADARAAAIVQACGDLPAWGFNAETARKAMGAFKWWPSVAEVRALILEATRDRRDVVDALRALAGAQDGAEGAGEPPPSPEAREAMATALRGLRGEMEDRARGAETQNPSGRPIKPGHLRPDLLAMARDASPMVQAARAAARGDV